MITHKEICRLAEHAECIVSEPFSEEWRVMHICKVDSVERLARLEEHYQSPHDISHRLICGNCNAEVEVYGSDG